MRKISTIAVSFCFILMATTQWACSQSKPQNWTPEQLEQPADLAAALAIKDNKSLPVIINVGPGAIIPHSIDAGMAGEKEGVEKFTQIISKLDKNAKIVIYCGCCPFDHCPNVRPAIDELKNKGFTNYYLLNLPSNINKDWISKGYPVNK